MFNDKILKSVAEAVKQVLTTEKLHPNQQKLDVHEPEKDKLTAKDFEMLRKGKKAEVKEANNPFDLKNYKSQLPTKPGEKAGFDSKKISTGTVYSRKTVKDEKPLKEEDAYDKDRYAVKDGKATKDNPSHMGSANYKDQPHHVWATSAEEALKKKSVKEGASQEDYLKEIEMAKKRAQGEGNPDLTKGKVTAVKQESVEQIDEATMTHITLGNKVKNSDGGHNQDVHYKGKKIGSIESYKHRTGLRYGAKHDASGDMEAGSRSPEEAVDFVRAAHADHLKSMKKESVEQIDELKKSTLASYVKKASHDVAAKGATTRQFANDSEAARKGENYPEARKKMQMADKTFAKSWKRREGMAKAVDKLAKEEVEHIDETHQVVAKTKQGETFKSAIYPTKEKALAQHYKMSKSGNFKNVETVKVKEEVEHIEERSMTEPEMKKREKIVKSMKKGMQGFKDRYGDRAKDVMYATATKQAMKD